MGSSGEDVGSASISEMTHIVVQTLLGLSKEDIIKNFYAKPETNNDDGKNNKKIILLEETYRGTIRKFLNCIKSIHGSLKRYLYDILKVTESDQIRLQNHFLIDLNFITELSFQITL